MCCNSSELACLGSGFSLYYNLKRNMTWLLFILSCMVGIPCTILVYISLRKVQDIFAMAEVDVPISYTIRVSVFTMYVNIGDPMFLKLA